MELYPKINNILWNENGNDDDALQALSELIHDSNFPSYFCTVLDWILCSPTRKSSSIPLIKKILSLPNFSLPEMFFTRYYLRIMKKNDFTEELFNLIFSDSVTPLSTFSQFSGENISSHMFNLVFLKRYSGSNEKFLNDFIVRRIKLYLDKGIVFEHKSLKTLLSESHNMPENIKNEIWMHYCNLDRNKILALQVLVTDGFLVPKSDSGSVKKFFTISEKLPYEMQCYLASVTSNAEIRFNIRPDHFSKAVVKIA